MRNATCVGTETSKVPTRVALLFIFYSVIMMLKLKYLLCPNVAKCKKDLVLLVDTSNSIGMHDFNHNLKKFLKNLVTDSRLNVGPGGTEIGLTLFSSRKRTMVKLRIGQITDSQQLWNYIDCLQWMQVSGGYTRTDRFGLRSC